MLSVPPPSHRNISFDWNSLVEPRLPSCIPFQIVVTFGSFNIYCTFVDEGASVSILSSSAWQAMGSPQLVLASDLLLTFDRRPSEPLGILPQLPILLGGKTVHLDVMVVQGPLDFNFLIGHDYIYAMKDLVSTIF